MQKTSHKPRARGRLAALPQMPLDILFEIFRSMHPRDLLHVSRTTKVLRAVLMNKSSIWIWKDSYAAASDLPPIAEGMTVPQFVSLAYDRICHFCSTPGVTSIAWAARIRYCKKCMLNESNFVSESEMRRQEIPGRISHIYIYRTSFASVLPCIRIQVKRREQRIFPTASVDELVKAYQHDEVDSKTWEEKQQWIESKEAHNAEMNKHAVLCETWDSKRQAGRDDELQQVRDIRKAEIVRRLSDLGWSAEIDHLGLEVFGKHKLVRKTQPVSEKTWLQIKGPLLEYMEEVKTERLAKEKSDAIRSRYDLLVETYREYRLNKPFRTVLPNVGDIVTIKEVVRIIEDTPYDQDVTESDLRAVLDAIPQSYFEDWRKRCDAALVKVLNSVRRKKPATKADLKLATTVFKDKDGGSDLLYPHVLVSDEVTAVYGSIEPRDDDPSTLCRHRPWSAEHLGVSYRHIAKPLVLLAGLDPRKATAEDMDQMDLWFVCTNGLRWSRRCAMTWRYAVGLDERNLKFELLGGQGTMQARQHYTRQSIPYFRDRDSLCAHCEMRFSTSESLEDHLGKAHTLTTITKSDYVLDLAFDSGIIGSVYLPELSEVESGEA